MWFFGKKKKEDKSGEARIEEIRRIGFSAQERVLICNSISAGLERFVDGGAMIIREDRQPVSETRSMLLDFSSAIENDNLEDITRPHFLITRR